MFATTKTLGKRALTSKLEVERKFVPTSLLKKYVSETAEVANITLSPTESHNSTISLIRQTRKRVMDKYFDRDGQLEAKGIWVRWRREQTTKHDGTDAAPAQGCWEAKIKDSGDFINSQFVEVKGKDAVEDLLEHVGIGRTVHDLRFELGFVADRVSWKVKQLGDEEDLDDGAALTLVVDTMDTSLEGPHGDHPKYLKRHQVGELEFEKTITTILHEDDGTIRIDPAELEAKHQAERASQGDLLNKQLEEFMTARPEICNGEGSPLGKLTAYIAQQKDYAARAWKANEPNRIANMAEVKWERLYGGK